MEDGVYIESLTFGWTLPSISLLPREAIIISTASAREMAVAAQADPTSEYISHRQVLKSSRIMTSMNMIPFLIAHLQTPGQLSTRALLDVFRCTPCLSDLRPLISSCDSPADPRLISTV